MSIPDYQSLMRPVLQVAARAPEWAVRDLVEAVATELQVSSADRLATISSGYGLWENRTNWAVTYLVKAGALQRPRRAVVRITERGRALLAAGDPITNKQLDQFEDFRAFRTRSASKPKSDPGTTATPELTPYELLSHARVEADALLTQDLLARAQELPPVHFERLVLRLLEAMGYGTAGSVAHTGKPGDGGFDGIVSQDPLGLDRIYVQAKRYAADNVVQAPAVREFVGALSIAQGERGVLLTTSRFSNGARDEAGRVHKRIELVDGERLAALMIQYGVGVLPQVSVTLHRLDEDFFDVL